MGSVGEFEHPYVPRDLKLPGFVPEFHPTSTILGVYILAALLAISVVWIGSGKLILPYPFPCFLLVSLYILGSTAEMLLLYSKLPRHLIFTA